ncbi:MAG: response regulator [Gammaproteobacteria bacterium]|nr:response regulator [Gammaproteobacteria bacterium]
MSMLSMHDLFRIEAENQVAILSQGLLDLEKDDNAETKLEALMRASHSLKGAARIAGLEVIVRIAHLLEDCFVAAQRGTISLTSTHVDLLFKAIDYIGNVSQLPELKSKVWCETQEARIAGIEGQLCAVLLNQGLSPEDTEHYQVQAPPSTTNQAGFIPSYEAADREAMEDLHITDIADVVEERVIRINADTLTRIMGLSSEIMVESTWLRPFTDSMLLLKRRQNELTRVFESLKKSLDIESLSERSRLQFSAADKKLTDCRGILSERLTELDDYDRRNSNLSVKMYNEVVSSRMRPFADAIQGLQRMVRDMARLLNKKVQLVVNGLDTPVDRDVLEKIKAPIAHLVRNAVDHGIEPPDIRQASNKAVEGKIVVSASHGGGMLSIFVEDDGVGASLDMLRATVIARELVTREMVENLTELELLDFLFLPDFTTKTQVTEYSGRGIGLDIVRNLVQEMHGKVWLTNNLGHGLKFTLQLPLTLSVITALSVIVSGDTYAFPLSRVDRILKVPPKDVKLKDNRQYISMEKGNVSLVSAAQVLELDGFVAESADLNVVVISDQLNRYGVVVDQLIGQRELSVQALDTRIGKVQDISAAALAEDGSPVLVIDVDDLVRSIDAMANDGPLGTSRVYSDVLNPKMRKRILVVDDSLTVREVERQILESYGYRVDVAVDGMDGWNAVRRTKYQLVITDIDMPRMDGIELVVSIKQDQQLKSLPIIIVSYKDRQADRQRGLEAGANRYLTKGSFHDETLFEAVDDLIGAAST